MANFCYHECDKVRLSKLIYNYSTTLKPSLAEEFQEYLFLKQVNKVIYNKCEEYKLVLLYYEYEAVKIIDEQACIEAFKF